MKHYIKADGTVWAFESDGSQDSYIQPDMTFISDADLAILRQPTALQLEQQASDEAKAALAAIDLASIRAIREYIVSKPDAPQLLKDREAAAAAERVKVKP